VEGWTVTHLSLFSGIGGIDLAADRAGFRTVAFVERDEFCQRVLRKHWPEVPIHDDVTTFDGHGLRESQEVTLVSAGFPCQPHSLAGLRQASGDERDLWGEVVRILREVRPRWFLGENVFGLLSSEGGRFFGRVLDDLAALGMCVGWATYDACLSGAPHLRRRVFLVAYADCDPIDGTRLGHSCAEGDWSEESEVWGEDWFGVGLDSEGVAPTKWIAPGLHEHQSLLVRGDDGVPNRVDRRRALGNAVVPQQVYPILREIAEYERLDQGEA